MTDDAFRVRYRAAAEALYGPLDEAHGLDAAALDEAEARLGFALPPLLRSWYGLAGALCADPAYDRLLPPTELRVTSDGALVFYEAHQGVVSWGVPAEARDRDDPSVRQCHDEQAPLWSPESTPLSRFALERLLVRSAEALPTAHRGAMEADLVAALKAEWPPEVDGPDGVHFLGDGVLLVLEPREETTIVDGDLATRRWADARVHEGRPGWRDGVPAGLRTWIDALAAEDDPAPDAEFYELVPDLAGLDEAAARRAVEALGFHLGVSDDAEAHPTAPAGTVLRQEPPAGDRLLTGSAVAITCSSGPDEVFLPSLAGKTVAEATSLLGLLGFRLGAVRGEGATVATSEPAGGTSAPRGAEVDVTLGD